MIITDPCGHDNLRMSRTILDPNAPLVENGKLYLGKQRIVIKCATCKTVSLDLIFSGDEMRGMCA